MPRIAEKVKKIRKPKDDEEVVVVKKKKTKKPAARSSYWDQFSRYVPYAKQAGQLKDAATAAYKGKYSDAAGHIFDVLIGAGGYRVKKNSLTNRSQVPSMHSIKDGFRIRHREYLGDVSSSIAFTNTVYNVNPGLDETFPWLSAIAQNFDQYEIKGMIVEFKSTSANALNSTNTALGTMILCAEYDSADSTYVNKQQMENSMYACSTKPSESMIMPIECDPRQNPIGNLYTRSGAVPSGKDSRLYDLCNFQIASVGSQAAAVVGELWISYDIILRKPQMSSGLGLALDSYHLQMTNAAGDNPLGTARTELFDTYGITATNVALTMMQGHSGIHKLTYNVTGDSVAVTSPIVTYTNAAEVLVYNNSASGHVQSGGTTTLFQFESVFRITDPSLPVVITFGVAGTLPTSPGVSDCSISQLNGDYV